MNYQALDSLVGFGEQECGAGEAGTKKGTYTRTRKRLTDPHTNQNHVTHLHHSGYVWCLSSCQKRKKNVR